MCTLKQFSILLPKTKKNNLNEHNFVDKKLISFLNLFKLKFKIIPENCHSKKRN
uniref:Uncharacterized protein n=1 Tax=Meloidogyne enterolobii TaxID=390850 RepID=A0A6V7Y991_MELEN|nr:unnamed protein product [Meloidogyne enterolobii]